MFFSGVSTVSTLPDLLAAIIALSSTVSVAILTSSSIPTSERIFFRVPFPTIASLPKLCFS